MKKFAACSFIATILVASTLLSPFSAAASASAATTVNKGIYKPTSIGIGTNINISTPDPGVATYVGRDMYIGGKPNDPRTLDANNAPTGSYAAEAEGLTVVRGKLAMNPIKNSWGGEGFRFGTVGFGSQFRPREGSTVLAVAGIESSITNMNTGKGTTSETATVGAWTKGAWVGQATKTDSPRGYDYTAKIAGPITYSYWDRNTNNGRQSVVKKQGDWFEGSDALKSDLFNQNVDLTNVNGSNYSKYNGPDGYLSKLSKQLASFAVNGKVVVNGFAESNSKYVINKYDNKGTSYTLKFDGTDKPINGALDTRIPNNTIRNTERLITFIGDGTSMQQVFTIAGSELSNLKDGVYYRGVDFKFTNIPEGASIVVNVTGADPVEFHNGWRFWWGDTEISRGFESQYAGQGLGAKYSLASQSIMWNFVDTTSLTIRGGIAGEGRTDWSGNDNKWTDDDPAAAMLGSILVPNGSFDDHVTTNGRVYVGEDFMMNNPQVAYNFTNLEGDSASVIDMDQERHNFPWSGTYTPDGSAVAWSKVDAAGGTPLAGSEWAIYASELDAQKNQNRIVSIVDNGTNDSDPAVGTIQFNHLNQKANIGNPDDKDYFTYYIRETKAPEGYELSNTIYTSKMFHTGDKLNLVGNVDASGNEISNPQSAIPNAKIAGTVSWTKVAEGVAEHTPLAGSEWKLTKTYDADGAAVNQSWTVSDQSDSGDITWKDIDDTSGKFTLEGLQPGTYTLVETQAPFGYNLNTTVYEFTVSNEDGSVTWTEDKKPSIDKSGNAYISDTLTTTSVEIPVTKSVRNMDWPKDGKNYVPFEFSIEATGDYADTAPEPISVAPKAGEADATKLNNITAAFDAMTFNMSHLSAEAGTNNDYAKTYTYTVKEVAPATGAVDKLRYSKAEYRVAVTVKALMDKTTGKYTGLTTSTTVTQVKDDMGNTVSNTICTDAKPDAIPASTFTNAKVLTDLPLTGAGWTENSMLLVGAGLMLLGGIAAGAYWFATKRRQDDPSDGAGR